MPPPTNIPERERLVLDNRGLARAVALDFLAAGRRAGFDIDDLASEATIGLVRAAADFDPSRGVRFSTLGYRYARHAVRDALTSRGGLVRVPRYLGVAARAKDPANVAAAARARRVTRLDDHAGAEPVDPAAGPPDAALAADELRALRDRLDRLDARERRVIVARFGLAGDVGRSLRALGLTLGLTPQGVLNVERRALAKLRQ